MTILIIRIYNSFSKSNIRKFKLLFIMFLLSLFGVGFNAHAKSREQKTYTIKQDGTGDFTTIQEGVNNASDGDTLFIYPGIYTEMVKVIDKNLNIVGADKDLCVLQYDTASYMTPTLNIAAGNISNITIYGMRNTIQEDIAMEGTMQFEDNIAEKPKNYAGYAVHIDWDYQHEKGLLFDNCRIISENSQCVGIGMRGGYTLRFQDCELISLGGGCIFLHDHPTLENNLTGEASLVILDCQLTNYLSPYIMVFHSLFPEHNTTYLTFQNVQVNTVAYASGYKYSSDNISTALDVDSLLLLEKANMLHTANLHNGTPQLIHELTPIESADYMNKVQFSFGTYHTLDTNQINLLEGISYIQSFSFGTQNRVKPQTIMLNNSRKKVGNGWCGLDSIYLTNDSFGNTLPEMNALIAQQ